MPGTRLNNTFEEGLNKLHRIVADLKLTDDADLEWLINLETMIIQKIRQPNVDAAGAAPMGQPNFPAPPMGGIDIPPNVMGGLNGAIPGAMPGGVPPMPPMPMSSNPDELRRLQGG